jgi:prepilin-type N-terminal cleavage/methylation domain-containing protein
MRRRAFTLIELMVTMSIMAILTAAMAYVMAGAQESAQIAKTRTLIARLHSLVMQKYESYRYRRLPITIPPKVLDNPYGNPIATPLKAIQTVRCDVLRQLMRMEMPERWTDLDDPTPISVADNSNSLSPINYYDIANPNQAAIVKMMLPSALQAYRGQATAIPHTDGTNGPVTYTPAPADSAYEGAKCLYLMVTMGLGEPDVMENFSEGDIGDFDGSGHKVFLDAWGKPIGFLRWAPGFISAYQPAKPGTGSLPATAKDMRMPDQTDPAGIYGMPQTSATANKQDTFALYPLIYSAGPDGYVDMVLKWSKSSQPFRYTQTNPLNNPFASVTDTDDFLKPLGPIGTAAITDDQGNYVDPATVSRALGTSDNIQSHSLSDR